MDSDNNPDPYPPYPGDIALYRPHNTLGKLISHFDKSRYCHVRLITTELGETVEADFKGAIQGRIQEGDVIVRTPLTVVQRNNIYMEAKRLVGTPYGFLDLLALANADMGFKVPFLQKRLESPKTLFCSQLVDLVWQRVGYHAFNDGRQPQDVTPGDIADLAFTSDWLSWTHVAD